jgi:methionyl-tRNA synthetase
MNADPHIGHFWEKIAADVLARWKRLQGFDVFFLTGADEHGTKIQRAAEKAGMSPKEFVDAFAQKFKAAWATLGISFDHFIRTTDPDHVKGVKDFISKMFAKGDIYKGEYAGWYCVGCEAYLTQKDIKNGNCPIHGKPVELLREPSYFFKLSKYQKPLLKFYQRNRQFIQPVRRRGEVLNRLREGLHDVSITRATSWGIRFLPDPEHRIWVWYDALLNYITALGWPDGKFKKFWPADIHIIGKEIIWFHGVIWPAMLLSAGVKLPKKIFAHGWLTCEGQKISKTLGNVIDPVYLAEKYSADSLRYYILRQIPFDEDGDFSEASLAARHNAELADDLGNLVQRILVLTERSFGAVPPRPRTSVELIRRAWATTGRVERALDKLQFHTALAEIWALIAATNKYVNDKEPWAIEDRAALAVVLYNLLESLRIIAVLIWPFIPATAEKIFMQLGVDLKAVRWADAKKFGLLKPGTRIARGPVLFSKVKR